MKDFICFLVDDDSDDREIFTVALEDADKAYKCITANNGIEAIEKLKADKNFTPDFIFLDLNMPFLSGKECLQEMKKIPRLSHIPVIIYSTSSYEKDIEETRQLGATHFLPKPSSIARLSKILSDFFQKQPMPFFLEAES